MTTIFADHKKRVMVCDSKAMGGATWYQVQKVYRVGDELVGFAGSLKECLAWLDWYSNGRKAKQPKLESFEALVLRSDGVYEMCADGLELRVERGFHGIGSGGPCAVAAFMAGADAKKAVDIACKIDNGSGGDVFVHRLKG